MSSTRSRYLHRAIVAAFALGGLAGVSQASFAYGPPAPAMKDTKRFDDAALPAQALRGTGIAGTLNANAMSAPQISFTLPDGRTITAGRQRLSEDRTKGRKSWVGTFSEFPGSIAVITNFKGSVTGFVSYGAETWELMPGKAGDHVMYRVDDKKLPAAEPEVSYPSASDNLDFLSGTFDPGTSATTATSGDYVHDLLVVYTPAARAAYGQATLESMVQNAVAAANQAYQNSLVGITLNLVGLQEVSYTETGTIQTSLNELRGTGDGNLEDVHQLRDTVGADVVTLLTQDTNACGIAGVMTTVSTSFAANAFNIVKPSCLSQHSLAHEIGHNQGNKHDRASTTGSGAYPYSYGFRRCMTDGTGFRTVMAYSCSGGARVAWFSNPNASYNGYATGIAYEADPANSADNARSMNNTAATVAAFRTSGSSTTAPSVAATAPAAPSGITATGTAYNSVTTRWTDSSSSETGFKVERSRNGVDYLEIATLGAGVATYVDNGVIASSNYYYRVRAYNSVGNSNYSNVASVTTPAVPAPPPAAPTSVSARNDGNGTATIQWGDASTNESSFEVRRERWDSRKSAWTGLTTVGTLPANVTSMVDTSGSGTYRYAVRATNLGGVSSLAGPVAVTVTGGASKGKSGK